MTRAGIVSYLKSCLNNWNGREHSGICDGLSPARERLAALVAALDSPCDDDSARPSTAAKFFVRTDHQDDAENINYVKARLAEWDRTGGVIFAGTDVLIYERVGHDWRPFPGQADSVSS